MFASYLDQMNKTCALLRETPESGTPIGRLVCSGLDVVAKQNKTYDDAVASEYPFKKHFFETLTSLRSVDEDTCFQLFEDLALFVRSRSLRFGQGALSQVEKEILQHFETSGQWQRGDRALVTESYWYELPERIQAK